MSDEERWVKNRRIAELLGYHAERDALMNPGKDNRWHLVDAKGSPVYWPSESEAGYMEFFAESPDDAWRHVPDYFGSLDAVADALPQGYITGKSYDLHISARLSGGYDVRIIEDTPPAGRSNSWHGTGDTRQEAAGEALLRYLEATVK